MRAEREFVIEEDAKEFSLGFEFERSAVAIDVRGKEVFPFTMVGREVECERFRLIDGNAFASEVRDDVIERRLEVFMYGSGVFCRGKDFDIISVLCKVSGRRGGNRNVADVK